LNRARGTRNNRPIWPSQLKFDLLTLELPFDCRISSAGPSEPSAIGAEGNAINSGLAKLDDGEFPETRDVNHCPALASALCISSPSAQASQQNGDEKARETLHNRFSLSRCVVLKNSFLAPSSHFAKHIPEEGVCPEKRPIKLNG
jgi:hypothetical protein